MWVGQIIFATNQEFAIGNQSKILMAYVSPLQILKIQLELRIHSNLV